MNEESDLFLIPSARVSIGYSAQPLYCEGNKSSVKLIGKLQGFAYKEIELHGKCFG
jgi:hypothetical protein